jgi:hypothetical protein
VLRELPGPLYLVSPLGLVGVVAAVRVAVAGSTPAFAALFLLPLVWLALRATPTQLGLGLAVAAGALVLSRPLEPGGWIEGGVLMLVGVAVCYTVQGLAGKVRSQTAMLEELAQRDAITDSLTARAWTEPLAEAAALGEPDEADAHAEPDEADDFGDHISEVGDEGLRAEDPVADPTPGEDTAVLRRLLRDLSSAH